MAIAGLYKLTGTGVLGGGASYGQLSRLRPRKQNIVFLVNVAIRIRFQFPQAIKQGPEAVAGVRRRREIVRQAAVFIQ